MKTLAFDNSFHLFLWKKVVRLEDHDSLNAVAVHKRIPLAGLTNHRLTCSNYKTCATQDAGRSYNKFK